MERHANVRDKLYPIEVDQKSKTVWVAVGEYMGKTIRVEARSERTAISHWAEAARYAGN
jgi:hypothetical protein